MINLITDLISFTQPTNLDKESLSVIESIAKIKNVVNECITQFNNLENKTDEDYQNFLKQITSYKNEVIKIINDIKNDNNSFKNEFREIIKSLENFNVTLEIIKKQSEYIQELAKINQDNIDKGTIVTKDELNDIAINAKTVGFKTDGSANDTALTTFKTLFSGKKLYFPNGTYCFKNALEFNNQLKIELSPNAELKCISDTVIDVFIDATGTGEKGNFLKGGTINANNKANYAIRLSNLSSPFINKSVIKNFNKVGLKTSKDINNRASNVKAENLYIYNESPIIGSIGILDDAYDNSFSDIVIRDIETCIDTKSSKFNRIHGWISFAELIPTSVYVILRSSECCFVNCTSDTIRYSFVSGYEGTVNNINYAVSITNMAFFYNKSVYTQDLATSYEPILFKKYTNSNGVVSKILPNLSNATITGNNFKVSFTDCEYTENISKNVNAYNVTYDGSYVENTDIIFERNLMYLKDLNTERYKDGNTDFNTIVHNGTYTVNTWSGTSGKNIPAQNISGVLIVIGNGTRKTQILNTKDNIYTRAFVKEIDGNYTFNEWIKFAKEEKSTCYTKDEFIKIYKNNGMCTLNAYVSSGANVGDSLFTIPESYRPKNDTIFYTYVAIDSNGNSGSVKIIAKTTGELLIENNNIYRGQIVMSWLI